MNQIINYLNQIQEGYIFSDKTISIDLDKFESGELNTLLIVGLIGSGKTTLGKYLAKKYKAEFLSTDKCIAWSIEEHPPNEKQMKQYKQCSINMIKNNNKSVVEGIAILDIHATSDYKKEILKLPMIIIGKSAISSSYNSMKRNERNKEDKFWTLLSVQTKVNIKVLQKWVSNLRKERIEIPGANIEEYKIPKL